MLPNGPRSGHMWESQALLSDGQVVFPRVLRFSPTVDARYKWNILERAVKPKSNQTVNRVDVIATFYGLFINFIDGLGREGCSRTSSLFKISGGHTVLQLDGVTLYMYLKRDGRTTNRIAGLRFNWGRVTMWCGRTSICSTYTKRPGPSCSKRR